MVGFILLLLLFLSIWAGLLSFADYQEVKNNWSKYRCRPNVLPLAALYGHDTAENFNFCLSNMFGPELGAALGPIFMILGTMVTTIMTLIQVANSLRVQFATMMGGINTLFQNFMDRFKQLVATVQMTGYRMKLIMGRLYGAFFAMIYMSIAGMTSMQNFTETVLFSFLDTFCFDPDTPVEIEGKGTIPIQSVEIGDVFQRTGSKVTATFQFDSDGQPMVLLPGGIVVSTNHYVQYLNTWVQAKDHPDAKPQGVWSGGIERPLICLNTSDHRIPIGYYTFLDYDETEEGDADTMKWIDGVLNRKSSSSSRSFDYNTCVGPATHIRMADGTTKAIEDIRLGDTLSTGRVIGVIQKQVMEYCELPTQESVAPGCSYWQSNQDKWVRAGDCLPRVTLGSPQMFYDLVVLKTATFETANGTFFRDYVEVHSPEAEQFYANKVSQALPVH